MTNIFRYPTLDALNHLPLIPYFQQYFNDCQPHLPLEAVSFNVLLYGDFKGVISSIENINEKYEMICNLDSGSLYRYKLPECDYFMFVPSECLFKNDIYLFMSKQIEITGYIWLSFLKNTEFRWHKDKIETRLHYPLFKQTISPSLQIENFETCYFKEHLCYVFNPQNKHCVPMQNGNRLHLVATCGKVNFDSLQEASRS